MWEFSRWGDRPAFLDENGQSITYHELEKAGKELAEACGGRCLVACFCRNTIGSAAGYACFTEERIVPMLLNAGMEEELREELLEKYRPAFLWIPEDMQAEFPAWEACYRLQDYVLVKNSRAVDHTLYDELALLLTTSGSTGSPKFVRQSYANILANTKSIIEYLGIGPQERPITTLPMNYTYGLSIINTHLYVGATALLTDKSLMQKEFWAFFKDAGATSFGGVPYTYEILDKLRFQRMDLPSLKTMTQAGGKLLPDLHEKFARYAQETGRKFFVMYGQCEATARMGYLPADMAVAKKGSMGIAIPGGRFTLLDEEENEITTPGTTGELLYEGDNVTLGYAECAEDLEKGDERGGRLKTGDMAQFDEDGYYYIVGRKKRFLKIYGNRVNLDEVERLLKSRFQTDLACGGIDDQMKIFVTDPAIADEVKAFAAEKTRLNPAAFRTEVLSEIPKTDSGKTDYHRLAESGGV